MMHACKHVPQKQHQVFPKITTSSLVAVIILHALLLIKLSVSMESYFLYLRRGFGLKKRPIPLRDGEKVIFSPICFKGMKACSDALRFELF
mmetsp:Transcript_1095/g.1693  ORF Transcript_1095/g.1693 Transcript_1095/m.1693 type:complete len:91 (-) Transcript_1095:1421-1693(-)